MKRFCRRGHDNEVVGRTANGACAECKLLSNRAWYQTHREEARASMKKWNANNLNKTRERNWKKAGIKNFTAETYDRLFIQQAGKCAICGIHSSLLKRPLVVDHDHKTGIVRGLLCDGDNQGLGSFNDSQERLQSAGNYIEQFKTKMKGEQIYG